jgi:hypothetical protein
MVPYPIREKGGEHGNLCAGAWGLMLAEGHPLIRGGWPRGVITALLYDEGEPLTPVSNGLWWLLCLHHCPHLFRRTFAAGVA